jgi:hypothetical protein
VPKLVTENPRVVDAVLADPNSEVIVTPEDVRDPCGDLVTTPIPQRSRGAGHDGHVDPLGVLAQPPHEDYTSFPVIPGHEPLGIIEEIGAQAQQRWGVKVGDRVAVRSGYGCGHCEACRRWEPRYCPKRGGTYGYTDVNKPPHIWGGYAEYMYLDPHTVMHKVSPELPADLVALYQPIAAGIRWAVQEPGTKLGDTVVILGCGQRGLGSLVAAREAGAAIAWTSGLMAGSYVLDYAARVWPRIASLRPLSLFRYYEPQRVLNAGLARADVIVFAAVAAVALSLAFAVFSRRDL